MKKYNLLSKNNRGSSPIVFFILIGIIGIIAAIGGLIFIFSLSYSRKGSQETITQVNTYIKKRNDALAIAEKIKNNLSKLTTNEIKELTNEYISKWEEIDNLKLPEDIKSIVKECHKIALSDAKKVKELVDLQVESERLNDDSLSNYQTQKANKILNDLEKSNSKEICGKADAQMKETLAKKGIKLEVK